VQRQWFESKIATFKADDIVRAEARRRIGMTSPLAVHTEMRKVHKQFIARGGQIRILDKRNEMPVVSWSASGKFIVGVVHTAHARPATR